MCDSARINFIKITLSLLITCVYQVPIICFSMSIHFFFFQNYILLKEHTIYLIILKFKDENWYE